jgi:hypothetical protein
MKEEDKANTSFITPFGTYCFIRMPEGLKNVGSTFSRLSKTVLESQVGRNIFTYVDCDRTSQVIRPTYSCPCPTDIRQPCRCS